MATRTLKAKYEASDDSITLTRIIYCHAKNLKEIYYQFEDEPEAAPELITASEPAAAASVAAAAPPCCCCASSLRWTRCRRCR